MVSRNRQLKGERFA